MKPLNDSITDSLLQSEWMLNNTPQAHITYLEREGAHSPMLPTSGTAYMKSRLHKKGCPKLIKMANTHLQSTRKPAHAPNLSFNVHANTLNREMLVAKKRAGSIASTY
jgi:hypothetical protein